MKTSPFVTETDRFAAAALAVDRLLECIKRRSNRNTVRTGEFWQHYTDSAAAIHSVKE